MHYFYLPVTKRKKLAQVVMMLGIVLAAAVKSPGQTMTPRSLNHVNIHGYYEYLPEGYSGGSGTHPLLILLHGMSDQGNGTTDLYKVIRHGTPAYIMNGQMPKSFTVNNQTFSFIMLFPQLAAPATASDVQALINYAKTEYRVDTSRIYLTGLSRGGRGTFTYATSSDAAAKTLAAIVPISSEYDPLTTPQAPPVIARNNLPVWALHNEIDPVIPSDYSKNWVSMINAYNPAPNPAAKLTIFDTIGHDAWTKAYNPNYRENGMNVYEWMLQYRRNFNQPPVALIGGNTTVTLPMNFTDLDGSTSYDSDGSITQYRWTQLSGPSNISIVSPTASKTRLLNFMQAGDYSFQLQVTDNRSATATATAVVRVQTAPPSTTVLTVYPNPVQSMLYFKITGMSKIVTYIQVRIYNMNGTVLRYIIYPINGQIVKGIDVSLLPAGTYVLQVREGKDPNTGATYAKTFLKL